MKFSSQLTMRVPVAVAAAVLLAGCYTVLKHPTTDLTAEDTHGGDYRYSDCASCHSDGFSQPLVPDPYGYTSSWYFPYYGRPWWLPYYDPAPGAPGGRWSGGSGGGSRSGIATGDDERHVGGRGGVRAGGVPSRPPVYNPAPGGGGSASPSVAPQTQGSGSSSGSGTGSSKQPAQAEKPLRNPPAEQSQPPAPPSPPPSQDGDKKKEKPNQDKPKDDKS